MKKTTKSLLGHIGDIEQKWETVSTDGLYAFLEKPRSLKILFIADSTSVHAQRWIAYFRDRGYKIYLISIGSKRMELAGIRTVANFNKFYYDSPGFLLSIFKTRRLIRRIKPDILHAHFVHQYGWLAALTSFHPFVLTPWGTDIFTLPHTSRIKIGKWLTRHALKAADALTAISEHLKLESVKLGARESGFDVVFLGVDTETFRPDIDTRNIRNRLRIDPAAPVILSNRNFAPLYNNDIVLEALEIVLQQHPEAVLVMQNAGGKPEREVIVKTLARDRGVEKAVRFLPQYGYHDMPPLYALADIYVTVPSWDAGPVSLLEAMACHCTPIISDLPAPGEWIKDGENGYVVPVRNSVMLANAICRLLADRKNCVRFNEINRNLIKQKAESRHQMRKIENVYLRLTATHQD